jgi:acyl-CoA reductase-like NAD-dependent aldehyde dehydrogenase
MDPLFDWPDKSFPFLSFLSISQYMLVENPATGEPIAQVACSAAADVDAAVQAAKVLCCFFLFRFSFGGF